MPRPIRSIDIYLPLDDNDGQPFEESKYASLEDELLTRFWGVTSIQRQFPLRGLWQSGTEVFQDRIVVFTVGAATEGVYLGHCRSTCGLTFSKYRRESSGQFTDRPTRSCGIVVSAARSTRIGFAYLIPPPPHPALHG